MRLPTLEKSLRQLLLSAHVWKRRMPTLTIVYLLGTISLLSLLLVGLLGLLLAKSSRTATSVTLTLLRDQMTENQSLRNQVRSLDPMTLNSLQYATGNSTSNDEEYVPSFDEGLTYQQHLQGSDYTNLGIPDDLHASGWDPITARDGGEPVTFGKP